MWSKAFSLLLLIGLSPNAFSQDQETSNPLKFNVHFDGLTKESRLERRQNSQLSQIRELSLGIGYKVQKELELFVEASAEEFNGDSELFISQAYLTMDFRENYFSSQVGQLYYPVGWLNEFDNYFLNQPFYYEDLFKGQKGIDIGIIVRAHPFKSDSLVLEGSCFEGRVFRAVDQRSGRAEKRPCSIGLRGELKNMEAYYTHFEHDLAFYDKVKADGLGFKWTLPPLKEGLASFGLWGEYWRIHSPQVNGPTSLTEGGFIYPYLDLWRFRVGYRFAPVKSEVAYVGAGSVNSEIEDQLFRAEYEVLKSLRLIYEDHQARQKNGIDLKDEWALRILFEFQKPTQ